uniref:Uncharacterized protein n=1 Tax=Anopheles albimanus TaxID=7167 RepID=A0A182F507_ANOAL
MGQRCPPQPLALTLTNPHDADNDVPDDNREPCNGHPPPPEATARLPPGIPSIVATISPAAAATSTIAFDYDNRYQFQNRHRHHSTQQCPVGWLWRGLSLLICALLPATPWTRPGRYMHSQRGTETTGTGHHAAPAAGGCVRWSIKHKSLPPPPPPTGVPGMEDFGERQQQHQRHRRRSGWWSRCPALHRLVSEAIKEFNFTSPTTTIMATTTTTTMTVARPALDSRRVEDQRTALSLSQCALKNG